MKRFFSVFAIFFALLLLILCSEISQTNAVPFTNIHIVAPVGDFGTKSSLALDSGGNPHISYAHINTTGSSLMYATWADSKFNLQVVDANGGLNSSLALDSSQAPHISYICENATGTYLLYNSKTSSDWNPKVVKFAQNGSGLSNPSLKLDSIGNPHIGYIGPDNNLEYATWAGSEWNIETIDPVASPVADPSLALDSEGKPFISYYDPAVGLKCAAWTGATWSIMVVEADRNVGRESSLAIDSWDKPHVSYDDDSNGNLKYARWTGSAWNIKIVDRNKHVGSLHSSLALDSLGNPHISYEDNAVGNLMHASWNVSAWNLQIVDSIRLAPGDLGVWGFPTSLALDEAGTVHISYMGYNRHDLKYAIISDFPSFLVTFEQTGLEDSEGKVLEVDSVDYTVDDLPKLFVWRAGSNHSFNFVPTVSLSSGDKLDWFSTSGLSTSQSDVLTVTGAGIVSAHFDVADSNSGTPGSTSQNNYLNYVVGLVAVAMAMTVALFFFVKRKKRKAVKGRNV